MVGLLGFLVFLLVFFVLAYHRASLVIWTGSFALLLFFTMTFVGVTGWVIVAWILYFIIFIPLNVKSVRRRFISLPLLNFYRTVMPSMSRTEREAISAGTVTWEGDLFRGNPDWQK